MKKTTINRRFKHAAAAFFDDDEERYVARDLSFAGESDLLKREAAARRVEKGDRLVKFLKRAFIFFPGVIYLFFLTLMILTFESPLRRFFPVLLAFLVGSFMTVFGIGNVKNPRHLVIPVSIVAVGVLAVSFFAVFGAPNKVFEHGIYFFPLALVAPFLAKGWVDSFERDSGGI